MFSRVGAARRRPSEQALDYWRQIIASRGARAAYHLAPLAADSAVPRAAAPADAAGVWIDRRTS
jgi:hypothetical protein